MPQNNGEAVRYYHLAADHGVDVAQNHLTNMYAQGFGGVAQNHTLATRYYRLAADQGHADAQVQLARRLALGINGLLHGNAQALADIGEAVRYTTCSRPRSCRSPMQPRPILPPRRFRGRAARCGPAPKCWRGYSLPSPRGRPGLSSVAACARSHANRRRARPGRSAGARACRPAYRGEAAGARSAVRGAWERAVLPPGA
mmetsp:Transcript_12841/g.32533  ORF Transcript_12841/g.32533 Transcript_12841/m.32533 type:complete len:200 (+) Transcript_12841:451-1050(+)